MEIITRVATEKDIPDLLELRYDLDRPRPIDENDITVFKNKIRDYFSDPSKLILVAEKDSKILGLISIIFLRRLNYAKFEMYITELTVTEKYRYQGIGKEMINYCIGLAKKRNCYRIRLESGNQRKESSIDSTKGLVLSSYRYLFPRICYDFKRSKDTTLAQIYLQKIQDLMTLDY